MEKSKLENGAMQIARAVAGKVFRFHRDREERINDAVSMAWQDAQTAPEGATERSIAYFAIKRVLKDRHFPLSERSIDKPRPNKRPANQRASINWALVTSPGDDPAEIVTFWLTFLPWLEALSPRDRRVAIAFVFGDRTKTVAAEFKLSAARVSQLRRELKEHWEVFTA